tara:strand:+ start:3265 stop:3420 length:156 start_codon:yes stop_codon:yes gene_type:complete
MQRTAENQSHIGSLRLIHYLSVNWWLALLTLLILDFLQMNTAEILLLFVSQ